MQIRMGQVAFQCALMLGFVFSSAADGRIWTDVSGAQQVEAEFILVQFDKVWLRRSDGRVFGVEATALSQADQEHVARLVRQRAGAQKASTQNPPGRIPYGPGRELCRLENAKVDESSGVTSSRRRPGFFWTHNDSGDNARVYLFDSEGRDRGSCSLEGVSAFDWEDIFSFQEEGKSYLVLCDTGNNGRAAPIQILHVIEEPAFDPVKGIQTEQVKVIETIHYSYEDDHRDCEAVGIDPTTKTILFVSKERGPECYVYLLKWPEPNPNKAFSAHRIAVLKLRHVTAMDVSPDGLRAMVLTYGDAYEFVREKHEDWRQAFSREPRRIVVPERIQGESICFGLDGKTLYLTSEQRPTPFIEVPPRGRSDQTVPSGRVSDP